MQDIHKAGNNIDVVTIFDYCNTKPGLDEKVGGIAYITQLTERLPSNANWRYYVQTIQEYAALRTFEKFGEYIKETTKSGKLSAGDLLADIEGVFAKLNRKQIKNDLVPIAKGMEKELERQAAAAEGKGSAFGIKTGFAEFDKCIWGMKAGQLIVIAGMAGGGKTAFALNTLWNVAVREQKSCAFFSLEMSEEEICRRFYSIGGNVDSYKVLSGEAYKTDKEALRKTADILAASKLFIDDTTNQTPQAILAKAKKIQRKQGLDLVVIDYLQKIRPPRNLNNSVTEIGEIARACKDMARILKCPVLCLAQPNRAIAKDQKVREFQMQDLRGSGEIEQEADIIAFLKTDDPKENEVKTVYLQMAKHRAGRLMNFEFKFTGKFMKFEEKNAALAKPKKEAAIQGSMEMIPVDDADLPF